MESEKSDDPYDNRFFWCFFKLNNGKIIDLFLAENYKNKPSREPIQTTQCNKNFKL
jgi:hypothetical protein